MLSLLLALENPLAQAVERYWAGEDVSEELQRLHEERPSDAERAYWLARARLERGECEEAAALLEGRTSEGPAWRLRMVEGLAAVCLGQLERAWEQLLLAEAGLKPDPLREQVQASLGLLAARRGEPGGAARLHAAGGDPDRVLPAHLRRVLDDALIGVLSSGQGSVRVRYDQRWWVIDLSTGLGREVPGAPDATPRWAPEQARDMAPCGEDWVWASPRGLERGGERESEVLVPARPGASLESPLCEGDTLWYLRRVNGVDLLVEGEVPHELGGLAVARFDVSEGRVLIGASDALYVLGPQGPEPLLETALPLRSPSWWP